MFAWLDRDYEEKKIHQSYIELRTVELLLWMHTQLVDSETKKEDFTSLQSRSSRAVTCRLRSTWADKGTEHRLSGCAENRFSSHSSSRERAL